jgi:hypothetical protein
MSSDLKTKSARANGAKSRGPATPEGRANSSRNSLRHGLSAKSVLLPAESREQFQLLLDAHIQQFHPASPVEMDLVEAMAVARWRLRRIWAIETSLLGHELERRAEDMDEEFTDMSADDRLAWVFQRVADNNQSLSLLARYEGNLNRAFDRAFKQLNFLKSQRQNEPTVNLPSGISNHCAPPQSCDSRGPIPRLDRAHLYLHRSASRGFSRHFRWQPAHAADSISAASTIWS